MLKLKLLITIIFISYSLFSYAQRGKNGAKTVTAANTVVNEYTTLNTDATAGATSITVANSGLNSNSRFPTTLSAGDLILIIQVQGASIMAPASSIDTTYGIITNYNNCGLYEFAEVLSVPNATTINVECPLTNNYTASGKTEVVRVPRYTSLTINSPGVLTGDTWSGTKGGICAVEVLGNTTINSGGTMDMSGKGFRGGVLHDDTPGATFGVNNYYNTNTTYGAEKGEGIAGFETEYDSFGGRYCRGAPANGGGGANADSHGGGGGANAGDTALWTGLGNPDTTTSATYVQAWNLETTNFAWAKSSSSGGGRGGYSYSSSNTQNPLTLGPWNTNGHSSAWGGDWRRFYGGLGGRPLDYSTGRIYMGGGGGAGDEDHTFGSAGANGGGIIFIQSYGNIGGTGQITSNGATAANSTSGNGITTYNADGAGGGGSGGTIILKSVGLVSGISASANGGNGGNQVKNTAYNLTNHEAEGPGGGGGGGYIAVSSGTITATVSGGVNGTTNSSGMTQTGKSFPPNGATKGGAGIKNAIVTAPYNIVAANDTICKGNRDTLTAVIVGTVPSGTNIIWYDSIVGGNVLDTGSTFITPVLNTSTTYYVGTCPGTFHQIVTVVVQPVVAEAGTNDTICPGSNTTLHGSGGGTYAWSPSAGLSNTNVSNPIASPTSTTMYYLTVTNSSGCKAVDSVEVSVTGSITVSAGSDVSICQGSSTSLQAMGGITYAWSPAASLSSSTVSNPIASPTSTTSYIVTVTNSAGCSAADTVVVTVNSSPVAHIVSHVDASCGISNGSATASGGTSYNWSNGQSTATASGLASGNYTVTVSNSFGCSSSASVTINQISSVTVAVSSIDSVKCYGGANGSVTVNASGGTPGYTYLWTDGQTGQTLINVSAGTYTVTVTDANGCTSTISAVVNAPSSQMTSAVASADTLLKCFGDNNGYITITVVGGGTPPYSYLWNSGQNTSAITNLTGGLYTITITDHNGCTNIRSVPVDQPSELYLHVSNHASQCSDSCSGEATSAVTGGTPFPGGSYSYLWNNGQTTENINSLCPGNYYLTVTDSNGCQKSDTTTVGNGVNVNSSFTASPSTGYSPLTVNFAASSTTSSNNYFWTFGDGSIDTTGGNPTHIYNYHADTTFIVCLVVSDSNCRSLNCQLINVEIHSKIVAPNVFTPNGDGKNDEFMVQDTSIATFSCIIFNRWGRKIYEWSDVNKGWDGKTASGADAPDGTYYYIITAKGYDNINYNLHGAIMLLR